jgi:hypothetical protein
MSANAVEVTTMEDINPTSLTMDDAIKHLDPNFHNFQRLPIQIRHKIWALNLPGPRLIEVIEMGGEFYGSPRVENHYINQESRNHAQRTHPRSFSFNFNAPLIAFNFATDTLLFGRSMNDKHIEFRQKCDQNDLVRVENLMVDTYLCWNNRKKDTRGWRLCGLSWKVFGGLRNYTALYTGSTDPLPFWAAISWFPMLDGSSLRCAKSNPDDVVIYMQACWGLRDGWMSSLTQRERFDNRYGGIPALQKYDPAIRMWDISEIHYIGLDHWIIGQFNNSDQSSWAELLSKYIL